MQFKIFSKQIGLRDIKEVVSIETSSPITSFCIKDKNTMFFTHGNHIGRIDNGKIDNLWSGIEIETKNKPIYGLIESSVYCQPSSIFYLKNNNYLYVVEYAGRTIRKIEIDSNFTTPLIEGDANSFLSKLFSKSPDTCKTSIFVTHNEEIYWTSEIVHRCFKYHNGKVSVVAGNGRAGYSVFNNPEQCHFNFPDGVCVEKDSILLSDTQNNCIRCIKNGDIRSIVQNMHNPRKIKVFKSKIFFIMENSVKSILENKINPVDIYKGNNLIDMEIYNNEIFALEFVS